MVRWNILKTGEIFLGEAGTNGQHAFYQLIHQGTQIISADFIVFVNTAFYTKDADLDVHEPFLSTFVQTKALAFARPLMRSVLRERQSDGFARVFEGNRPTTSTLVSLTRAIVTLLHSMNTLPCWSAVSIDSYDQWGVES